MMVAGVFRGFRTAGLLFGIACSCVRCGHVRGYRSERLGRLWREFSRTAAPEIDEVGGSILKDPRGDREANIMSSDWERILLLSQDHISGALR
ncbi:hypothetical protein KC19_3G071100 [Ceratodon purpureus]|uniref:Secreted protein n=1 Tax=Ceratodon purpureus TaxID=3225 RepID=A0A8T0IJF0_CERPU|nr:hypothetical protein KC19_3G071100 [Ceratodon purpureus]